MAVNDKMGLPRGSWRDFWCSEDARRCTSSSVKTTCTSTAWPSRRSWMALRPGDVSCRRARRIPICTNELMANHHILLGKKKASSSGAVKPPYGRRAARVLHGRAAARPFPGAWPDQKSVGFKPKPFDPDESKRNDPARCRPGAQGGRAAHERVQPPGRSCFYEAQKNFEGWMPLGRVSDEVRERARLRPCRSTTPLCTRLSCTPVMSIMDTFIRWANKYWTDNIRTAEKEGDEVLRRQVLVDCFYLLARGHAAYASGGAEGLREDRGAFGPSSRARLQLERAVRGHG